MSLLPKSIHRCRRYPTKFNSGRDIPLMQLIGEHGLEVQYCTYFNTLLFPPIAAARVARRWLRFPDRDGKTDFDMRLPGVVEHLLERLLAFESHAIDRVSLPIRRVVTLLGPTLAHVLTEDPHKIASHCYQPPPPPPPPPELPPPPDELELADDVAMAPKGYRRG